MLPFLTQPAVAPACYVPKVGIGAQSQLFKGAQHLQRTPTMVGNRRVWTFSGWVSRAAFGSLQYLMFNRVVPVATPDLQTLLQFDAADSFTFDCQNNGSYDSHLTSAAVFRDTAWMHVHAVLQTPHETPPERARLTINGRRITSLSAQVNAVQHYESSTNDIVPHRIGVGHASMGNLQFWLSALLDGVIMVDGQALPETVFGEFNIHGVWVPKPKTEIHAAIAVAGGFGTNGFHLDFSDPLNPGKDVSGKGNHFTAVGFDAAGKDTVASTPTNRYATLSPLTTVKQGTLSDGNLKVTASAIANATGRSDLPISRTKPTYWAAKISPFPSVAAVGLVRRTHATIYLGGTPADEVLYWANGQAQVFGAVTAYGMTYTTQEIGVYCDPATQTVTFYRDGVSQGAIPVPGLFADDFYPSCYCDNQTNATIAVNFGQREHGFVQPAGAMGVCTDTLPEPDIKDAAEAFTQATATGASMAAVLEAGCAHWNGQWVEIIKRRDASEDWRVRFSDDSANAMALNTAAGKIAAPTLAGAGNYWGCRLRTGLKYGVYTAEVVHVAGSPTTVTHGLEAARNSVILKATGAAGGDWRWWHPDLPAGKLVTINGTLAAEEDATIAAVSANSFQIAAGVVSGTYRVLVLAEGCGHISLTSHIGTGAADAAGAFVSSVVSPDLYISRRWSYSGDPALMSSVLSPANPATKILVMNTPGGEVSYSPADLVVGGVKLRGTTSDAYHNTSGANYISLQIGRPIGGVCVAPATAR